MSREILDHAADIRIRIKARSFPVALLQLSNFMMELMYGDNIRHEEEISSSIRFTERENCVVRFLNDILYFSESKRLALNVKTIILTKNDLKWIGFGEKLIGKKQEGWVLIKAATYDRLIVSRDPAMIEITFDI